MDKVSRPTSQFDCSQSQEVYFNTSEPNSIIMDVAAMLVAGCIYTYAGVFLTPYIEIYDYYSPNGYLIQINETQEQVSTLLKNQFQSQYKTNDLSPERPIQFDVQVAELNVEANISNIAEKGYRIEQVPTKITDISISGTLNLTPLQPNEIQYYRETHPDEMLIPNVRLNVFVDQVQFYGAETRTVSDDEYDLFREYYTNDTAWSILTLGAQGSYWKNRARLGPVFVIQGIMADLYSDGGLTHLIASNLDAGLAGVTMIGEEDARFGLDIWAKYGLNVGVGYYSMMLAAIVQDVMGQVSTLSNETMSSFRGGISFGFYIPLHTRSANTGLLIQPVAGWYTKRMRNVGRWGLPLQATGSGINNLGVRISMFQEANFKIILDYSYLLTEFREDTDSENYDAFHHTYLMMLEFIFQGLNRYRDPIDALFIYAQVEWWKDRLTEPWDFIIKAGYQRSLVQY